MLSAIAPQKGEAMSRATKGERITVESSAALTLNRFATGANTGLYAHTAAGDLPDGVVVAIGGESAAPYTSTLQISGIAQVESDGAGAIDEKDWLEAGATAGQAVTRALTDGTTLRYFAGRALSPAAATAGLMVDILLRPHIRGGA